MAGGTTHLAPPDQSAESALEKTWTFELSSDLIQPHEQDRFDGDLTQLGIDRSVWDVYNATLQSHTRFSRARVFRGYDQGQLIGIALIYECRKTGECFFNAPVSTLMDLPRIPMFVWLRYGVTVDHVANPGFVVSGVDRNQFVGFAIRSLLQSYLFGTVVEYADAPVFNGVVRSPFVDSGVIDLTGVNTSTDYVSRSKNVNRKRKKFGNKGGEIRIIEGRFPPELQDRALNAFNSLNIAIRSPFQDNYLNMAASVMSLDKPESIHFVALLDGEYAGHQSFNRSGRGLHCQAGAFDRTRKSTYHAYENIIVSSVEYGIANELARIDYGPVLNETKTKMMTGFIPCENRTYARFKPIASALPLVIRNSKISADSMERWMNLGERSTPSFL
jgi:hypothetical protein